MHISMPSGCSGTINIAVTWELNYWATRFGVSPDELIGIVAEVGTGLADVRDAVFGAPPQRTAFA